jgi:hypothetical protein
VSLRVKLNSLASDLRRALNPSALADGIGMVPDPWQDDVLRSWAPRILLNCHRQSGKSTTASLLAVHTAVYWPDSLIPVFSPSLRQSGELFKKCLAAYQKLGRPVVAEAENALSLILENGSRIVSLPGIEGTVRGLSGARLIILDEAARVTDALITAIRPMLAVTGGRFIAMSTPNGKRGFFWDAWENGGKVWKRVLVTADMCPRITKEFLEEERLALGDRLYEQEYMGRFLETKEQLFGEEQVKRIFSRDVQPL